MLSAAERDVNINIETPEKDTPHRSPLAADTLRAFAIRGARELASLSGTLRHALA